MHPNAYTFCLLLVKIYRERDISNNLEIFRIEDHEFHKDKFHDSSFFLLLLLKRFGKYNVCDEINLHFPQWYVSQASYNPERC